MKQRMTGHQIIPTPYYLMRPFQGFPKSLIEIYNIIVIRYSLPKSFS